MNEKARLLLVEDTKDLAAEIYDFLEAQGMEVDYAATGKQAISLLSDHRYDVIILPEDSFEFRVFLCPMQQSAPQQGPGRAAVLPCQTALDFRE